MVFLISQNVEVWSQWAHQRCAACQWRSKRRTHQRRSHSISAWFLGICKRRHGWKTQKLPQKTPCREMVYSILRAFLHLSVIGFVLQFIFTRKNSGWIHFAYFFMCLSKRGSCSSVESFFFCCRVGLACWKLLLKGLLLCCLLLICAFERLNQVGFTTSG